MRSSVSFILSHGGAEAAMSHPDYPQQAQHHACLLVLVRGVGGVLNNFNKLWERVQRVSNIKVTDSSGQIRDIWVRYVREYPVENNDWGDFQTHRRLLGLITLSKYSTQAELNEVCRVHESLKVKYSGTLYDSRAFMFCPGSNSRQPKQESDLIEDDDIGGSEKNSFQSDGEISSIGSYQQSSTSSLSNPIQEDFTTPSNFKTHALFYGENDPVPDLEQHIAEFINSLFWVVESKRLERSREKLDKVSLILAPFEKKDFVGLDIESRNNKRRCMGRVTKNLADLTLQAGLVTDSLSLYHSAAEILKSVNDWLWLGAAYEGLCAASAILTYPNLRNCTPLHRNASLQESSPHKVRPLSICQQGNDIFRRYNLTASPLRNSKTSSPVNPSSEHTPTSSESADTSSRQSETDHADTESVETSSEMDYQGPRSFQSVPSEMMSIPRPPTSQVNSQYLLSPEDIADKYTKAIIHYSKYQNAGIIETEACFKAARISVEQNNSLHASTFLQNVIFIKLNLSEQEKIQRFDTLAELYTEIGFLRKAAFCQRLAATRQVSPSNPQPDWQRCYYLMLHSFPGHKLSLDPSAAEQHQIGWPALQIQLLQEVIGAARRMGHPALATRHCTFLLQTMWPHLSRLERRDLAIQLQALSAQCEGGPVPLVLETGEVIPPANLTHLPQCLAFTVKPLPPARAPHELRSKAPHGPFIFTPIHFSSLERRSKKDEGKMDYLWVEEDICEVQLKLNNPLPFELKVSNMRLMTSGVVFESIPETIVLAPDTPTTVNLHGSPKEIGELNILGYSTHTLGVKSNCRLKNMPTPNKFAHSYTVNVIPSLPTITIETSVLPCGNGPSSHNIDAPFNTTSISLYNGESTVCTIKITNTSSVPIQYLDLTVQSNIDSSLQSKVFQWSNEDIQSQLPLQPNHTATVTIQVYGEADFLDLGGTGADNLFPNSLTWNCPSRVGSPTPTQPQSLPHTQSSNQHTSLASSSQPNRQLSASFRSTGSHATSWSAPLSVLPPSRSRQIESTVSVRYSGGAGVDTHCRQSTLRLRLELLPSVAVTHWDALPAEVPTQLYLVLDITNLTAHEMELQYGPGRHMLVDAGESCRVPAPAERCLYTDTPDHDSADGASTGSSTASLELMCAEHIARSVDLRWRLPAVDVSGRATVKGITLSQAMLDVVRMSPLSWEVRLNSTCMSPQAEYACSAGERVAVSVSVSNQLTRPLHDLRLSVQCYQDYNNGVTNYRLDNRVAMAGVNKKSVPILEESASTRHECTVVFLCPGEYKMDVQCSTSEPQGEVEGAIARCQLGHVWRFIPPVSVTVTE